MIKFVRHLIQSAAAAFLIVAIGFNAASWRNSDYGIEMSALLDAELGREEVRLAGLRHEAGYLGERAKRLTIAELDDDLLEERVRSVLGLVRPDELLVSMDELDALVLSRSAEPASAPALVEEMADRPRLAMASLAGL